MAGSAPVKRIAQSKNALRRLHIDLVFIGRLPCAELVNNITPIQTCREGYMYLHTLYRFSARPGCANSSRNSTQKKQGHETGGALLGFQDMGRGVDDSNTWLKAVRAGKLDIGEGSHTPASAMSLRSEERRVGKECRSRWSPYH